MIKWVETSNGDLIRWDKVVSFDVEYHERDDSSHRVSFRIALCNEREYLLCYFVSELVLYAFEIVKYHLLDYINKSMLSIISQTDLQDFLTSILSKIVIKEQNES